MKNICFFIGNISNSGGTERVTTIIANELQRCGYNIFILSLSNNGSSFFKLNDEIQTHALFSSSKNMKIYYFNALFRLRRFIRKMSIDILINVDSILTLFSVPALYNLKTRNICWEHFNFTVSLGTYLRPLGRRFASRYCDAIITLTEKDKNLWTDNIRKIIPPIIPINNPATLIETATLPTLENRTVLAVGRLTEQKGFDLLIESWALISKDNPDWKLIIVGDGELKESLSQQIRHHKLQDTITINPTTNDIGYYYQQASIYCLSSRFEGFPMVLLEAQAYGLPIVAFNCNTGPSDLVQNGNNGYLAEPLDINSLATKLQSLMRSPSSQYNDMVQASLNNIQLFTLDKVMLKWIDLIEK